MAVIRIGIIPEMNTNSVLSIKLVEKKNDTTWFALGLCNNVKNANGLVFGYENRVSGGSGAMMGWYNSFSGTTVFEGDAFRGVVFGAFNDFGGGFTGVNLGGAIDAWNCNISGLLAGGAYVNADNSRVKGAMLSVLMTCAAELSGAAISMLNIVDEKMRGFALGIFNLQGSFRGFRIGAINISKEASKSVDVGLLNIRVDAPWYAKVIPFVAVRYSDKTSKKEVQ